MKMFQELSKSSSDFGGDKSVVNLINSLDLKKTEFTGYTETSFKWKNFINSKQ